MTKATKIAGAGSIILLLLLSTTDPQELPSAFLIVPFLLLFITAAGLVAAFLESYGRPKARSIRVGLVAAAIPVLLLALQSLGQLTIRDVLAIFALFGVTYFYLSRLSAQSAG